MEEDLREELEEVTERWQEAVDQVIEEPISPYKKDIFMELFGLVWLPYYAFDKDGGWMRRTADGSPYQLLNRKVHGSTADLAKVTAHNLDIFTLILFL